MKAILIAYEGEIISEQKKEAIARSIAIGAHTQSVTVNTFTDEEVSNICAQSIIKTGIAKPSTVDMTSILEKSVNILGDVITTGSISQMDIFAKLLKMSYESEDREAITNAIRVLGLYKTPSLLKERFNVSAAAIAAMKALCNNKFV